MVTIFKKELKRTRKGLLIWSLIIGLTAYLGILEYPVLAPYSDMLTETLSLIPKIAQLVFGIYNVNLGDTLGYYIVMYYWCGLIVFAHATYSGASVIAKEQRDRTAEFLFTKPHKRSEIVTAKIWAALVNICVVGVVALVMSLLALISMPGGASIAGRVLLSGLGMFLTQCVLMAVGLLCSAVSKTYKSCVTLAMGALIAGYCLMFFVQYIDMPILNFLSPLTYFGVSEVVSTGLSVWYLLLAAVVIFGCITLTVRFYRSKPIIV